MPTAPMHEPKQILRDGRAVLDPLMREHGFEFVEGESGNGSGGVFARASYVCNGRRLDLSVRRSSLGLVTYRIGEHSISHKDYVRAVSSGRGAYPGFPSKPVESFRNLRSDLEQYGDAFFRGSAGEFAALAKQSDAEPSGFGALPKESK